MINSTGHLLNNDGSWQAVVKKYNHPSLGKSLWQICNSFIPYAILLILMYFSLEYAYWITLLLAIPASGFLVRLFIIFHDCGHGAFFKSKKANMIVGIILGIFAVTPYKKWHQEHYVHHSTTGNLDKRGIGDIWTLTLDEYLGLSKRKQAIYRAFRHPFFLFTVGPLYLIFVQNRFTKPYMSTTEKYHVYFTNLVIIGLSVLASFLIGVKAFLFIQFPIIFLSHLLGLWLFYVQHQFDEVSWERSDNWNYQKAAIKGSSFLKLPAVLQWFTGNIGFHHVHHLSSKIPNYNLARCHYENELFKDVKPVYLIPSFKTFKLNLWDEKKQKMINFSEVANA